MGFLLACDEVGVTSNAVDEAAYFSTTCIAPLLAPVVVIDQVGLVRARIEPKLSVLGAVQVCGGRSTCRVLQPLPSLLSLVSESGRFLFADEPGSLIIVMTFLCHF